ncbi:hypothetical protein FOCC_FOCC003269 [Frankliniella occidentalis]|nr:hypothetical protein FOCC_FOCC003269 [Frankliniella occidentalis]
MARDLHRPVASVAVHEVVRHVRDPGGRVRYLVPGRPVRAGGGRHHGRDREPCRDAHGRQAQEIPAQQRGGPRRHPDVVPAGGLRDGVHHVHPDGRRCHGRRRGRRQRAGGARGAVPAAARALPVLRHGLLLRVPHRVAPGRHLVRGEPEATGGAGAAARSAAALRLGPHQAVPHVPGAHREGRGLRADDVQALQARLLLVLPRLARRRLPPAALRQGPLQEQTGPQPRLRHLAPDAGHRHLRWLRHPAARGLPAAAAGRALHRVLQVPRLRRCGQAGRRGRSPRRRVGVALGHGLLRKPKAFPLPPRGGRGTQTAPPPVPLQAGLAGLPHVRGRGGRGGAQVQQEARLHGRAMGRGEGRQLHDTQRQLPPRRPRRQ